MSSAVLMHTNGSTGSASSGSASSSHTWMQQSVQQFFKAVNWDDHPPELQALKQSVTPDQDPSFWLTMTVQQFFSAMNWEDSEIAALPDRAETANPPARTDAFTLDDFSDLF